MDEELRLKLSQSFLEWKAANATTISTLTQQFTKTSQGYASNIYCVFVIAAVVLIMSIAWVVCLEKKNKDYNENIVFGTLFISMLVSVVSGIAYAVTYYHTPAITDLLIFR